MPELKEIRARICDARLFEQLSNAEETVWINPSMTEDGAAVKNQDLSAEDIQDAENRLQRFAPFIKKCFPETEPDDGLIESDLVPIPGMHKYINDRYESRLTGRLLLKQDSHLAIAGSVKARGGIYEVLKHTEDLLIEQQMLPKPDQYDRLADPSYRKFFSQYTIQVGSTGNLGMSIGIISAAIGYQVTVHMSADAKKWKKDLLRSRGVTVLEYPADYSEAVKNGRRESDQNPKSYFIDDENAKDLFFGYATAAKRLKYQLDQQQIKADPDHPLFVYIPCGVGGAPGGISYGLKQIFKDSVHCFFTEPTQAPCMLLGMASGFHSEISVQDIGLSGETEADGLAVGRPSGFIGRVMEPLLGGIFTVRDQLLYDYMRAMLQSENIFLEPSACAAFAGPINLMKYPAAKNYLQTHGLTDKMEQTTHVVWATGGSLVPPDIRRQYQSMHK